ncbi:MAG: aminotransferase class IV [Bacteroidales bacterium]|nr:aminotransferase class IV [Bacteroidales bacterium]
MSVKQYILFDGNFIPADSPSLPVTNRIFYYGDGLYELIHANGTEPQFLSEHLSRLSTGMNVLSMNIPGNFVEEFFRNWIIKLLNKNRLFQGVQVRLTVFRKASEEITQSQNEVSWIMESKPLEYDHYHLNSRGLTIDIFSEIIKPVNVLSNIKSVNALLYVLAERYKTNQSLDECILLNQKGRIIESTASNIFIVKAFTAYTPAIAEGCVAGTMRHTIISLLKKLGYVVKHDCSLTIQDLELADEIFLTNAITGVRWVLAFRKRRYYNKTSKVLTTALNELAFG